MYQECFSRFEPFTAALTQILVHGQINQRKVRLIFCFAPISIKTKMMNFLNHINCKCSQIMYNAIAICQSLNEKLLMGRKLIDHGFVIPLQKVVCFVFCFFCKLLSDSNIALTDTEYCDWRHAQQHFIGHEQSIIFKRSQMH